MAPSALRPAHPGRRFQCERNFVARALSNPVTDAWGGTWDGVERAASTLTAAKNTCEAINGRVPTPDELYRVSAVRSASVGKTSDTNYLWSLAPYSPSAHVTLRLSDATTSSSPDTSMSSYRCTCAPAPEVAYTGKSCFGPPGAACYALATDGGRYNIDKEDRVALSKGAATWECAFYKGHIASPLQYTEAITKGVGAGSGAWLHTSDDLGYDYGAFLEWTDAASFVLEYSGGSTALTWASFGQSKPFRCAGVGYAAGTHPVKIADEFVGVGSGYKGEAHDLAGQGWAAAHDTCTGRGGHLPTRAELAALVAEGLPNGSGALQWTSDELGYDSGYFSVGAVSWVGAPKAILYNYVTDIFINFKATEAPAFRCVYYPIDAVYKGPPAATCTGGGCFAVTVPGASGATMWFDSADRAAGATLTNAVKACQAAGGRVPSERDLTEAIRKGLPNGSGSLLWTSDLEQDTQPTPTNIYAGMVLWSGVNTAFTGQWDGVPANLTWAVTSTVHPYRCMWTNELR